MLRMNNVRQGRSRCIRSSIMESCNLSSLSRRILRFGARLPYPPSSKLEPEPSYNGEIMTCEKVFEGHPGKRLSRAEADVAR